MYDFQVCIPNNCEMVQGEEVCRDEDKVQIQNVPQEECELQPEENCHAEAVLVPRSDYYLLFFSATFLYYRQHNSTELKKYEKCGIFMSNSLM